MARNVYIAFSDANQGGARAQADAHLQERTEVRAELSLLKCIPLGGINL